MNSSLTKCDLPLWQELEDGRLHLIHGDFLAQQPDALLGTQDGSSDASQTAGQPNRSAGAVVRLPKVVANLPYNVTKSILRRLLPLGHLFSDLYLMLQVRHALPCMLSARQLRTVAVLNSALSTVKHVRFCRMRLHSGWWQGQALAWITEQ